MKYRWTAFLLFLLAMLTLSGCACEHEWLEADCITPQVCIKCKEVGESALGHDWLDATCIAPETCARCAATEGGPLGHDWLDATCTAPETCAHCSETQGETLAHAYDEWSFTDALMAHTCSVCNYLEELPIDRELYLESLLEGFWDYWFIEHHGDTSHGGSGTDVNYLVFGDNRSCQLTMTIDTGIYKGRGTWELKNYTEFDDGEMYQIYVHTTFPRDEYLGIELYVSPGSMNKISFVGPNYTRWFYQEQGNILEGICTGWAITDHYADHSYCFQFRPDHTVTCYMEGIFEGIWSLGAEPEDRSYVSYIIEYVRDGKPEEFKGYFYLPSKYYDVPTLELSSGSQIFVFHQVNDTELAIVQNTTDLFAGNWVSTGFGFSNPQFADSVTNDYSLTVEKNGRFTLMVPDGMTYDGTWSAYATHEGYWRYYLYFTEQKKQVYCYLDTRGSVATVEIGETTDVNLFFTQVPEAYPIHTLPLGTWTGNGGCSITFHEDGTFTGLLDRQVRGTWTFYHYYESTYYGSDGSEWPHDNWTYMLFFEGEAEPEYLSIEKGKSEEQFALHIPVTDSDGNRTMYVFNRD